MSNRVCLALNICTYKRQQILKDNLRLLLSSKFFDKSELEYYDNLVIFVTDNASEVTLDDLNNGEIIHLFYNHNTGGSGGFQRGIEEIRKYDKDFTHVIFMDDDVKFELSSFYCLFDFLRMVDKANIDRPVAGRMFDVDNPTVQWTAAEKWNNGNIEHVEFLRDLSQGAPYKPGKVFYDTDADYGGWWFCCYPYSFVKDNDIIPFFIHCDDVEYGLRYKKKPIIIEGVQVWHKTWEKKASPEMLYYDTRNPLFVNELYGLLPDKETVIQDWKTKLDYYHNKQEWLNEYMVICGMKDFLKGITWLYKVNSESYHKKMMNNRSNRIKNALAWRCVLLVIRCSKKNYG